MEIKPVKEAKTPGYPVKENVTEEQIKRQIPKRWTDNKAAKLALGALAAMTLTGCDVAPPLAGVPMPPETSIPTESPVATNDEIIDYNIMGEVMAPTIMVAPLFEHGSGQGAFGCVMVAPPVFLTEAEALAVINEAAEDYGLKFSAKGTLEIPNVLQPVTAIFSDEKDMTQQKVFSFKPDFADAEHGIVMEFVSADDVNEWEQESDVGPSVGTYDTKDAAQQLSDALAYTENLYGDLNAAGVLYDPCELSEESEQLLIDMSNEQTRETYEKKTRALSQEQLKKQAVDFFEWLNKQGLI